MIKVVLADDHSMIREGISQLLELNENIKVIGEAANGKECLQLLSSCNADVLLLDINMPEMNGIEVLQAIKIQEYNIKVLMLTIHNEVEYVLKAIDLGADGYILKDSGSRELFKAVECVYNGERFIQPELTPALNSKLIARSTDQTLIDELTKREVQVLKLLAEGLFNKEIADMLAISERTVKNHISNIFKKIGVADRTQAAVFAIRNGMIDI